jgi:cytochrome c oxidase cbb3-type subunit 3
MILRLVLIGMAAAIPLAISGCSASASDPSPAASDPPQAAGTQQQPLPGTPTEPTSGTVPPALAPVGPIPGPQVAGEDPSTTIQNPYASDPSALEQGRELFVQMNCAGCHGGHAGGGMGPDLRPDHIFKFGSTPADLFDSISMGRGMGMPSWGTKLPPPLIWKLVTYIQSLGTQQEPDKAAPPPAHAPDSIATPSY